jgi:multidrug resistance efflux pump
MNGKGVAIVLGILLLVAMFFGARMMLDSSAANTSQIKAAEDNAARNPTEVVCWGNFDVEPGIAGLYPKQSGDVKELKLENEKVKKGDVLLQLEDTLAKLKVEEAEAAVKGAEQQLEEAKKLPELYKLQWEMQQNVINAIGHERSKLERERDSKLSGLDDSQPLKKTITELYEFALKQVDEKKKAEENKLKQIKLQDADIKFKQAEADLEAKRIQHKQAQELLKHFRIVAPSDGIVLRVFVHKGETLGPNPRVQALDFQPDAPIIVRAEVLQEWGRHVKEGLSVTIEDDTYRGPKWEGTVKKVLGYYAQTRTPVIEPFRYNDVRTLECIIELKSSAGAKIGQRVRANVKI